MEKLTHAITIKVSEADFHFVDTRCQQKCMESVPEYIRHLVVMDKQSASRELKLLAKSLRAKVSLGFQDSTDSDESTEYDV